MTFVAEADTRAYLQAAARPGFRPLAEDAGRGFLQRFSEAWASARYEDLAYSREGAYFAEYEGVIEEVRRTTGVRLFNPVTLEHGQAQRLKPGEKRDFYARFDAELDKLRDKHPDLAGLPDRAAIQRRVADRAAELRGALAAGFDTGFGGLGRFLGTAAAVATDPVNVLSMTLGAPGLTRAAGATLMRRLAAVGRVALTEGAIGAGTEGLLVQPRVFAFKGEIGSPYTVGDALLNVAGAGLGGAVLGGLAEGASQGFGALLRRWRAAGLPGDADTRAAEAVLEAHGDPALASPFPHGLDFDRPHTDALLEAEARALAGDPGPLVSVAEQRANQAARISEFVDRVRGRGADIRERPDAAWYQRPGPERAADIAERFRRHLGHDFGAHDGLAAAVHALDEDGVRHALGRQPGHGTVPYAPEDFAKVPEVVATGEIVGVRRTERGLPGVEYRKLIDGEWVHVVEELQRQVLAFKTGYKNLGPGGGGGGVGGGPRRPGVSLPDRSRGASELTSENGPGINAATGSSMARRPGAGNLPPSLREPQGRPEPLLDFLAARGGLRDGGGELRHAGIRPGARGVPPGLVRTDGGSTLDDAALAAWEAGFLPGPERPTVDDLLRAVADDFAGAGNGPGAAGRVIRPEDGDLAAAWRAHDDQWAAVHAAGVDPRGLDEAGLADALTRAEVARAAEGLDLEPADLDAIAALARDRAEPVEDLVDAYVERAAMDWYENVYRNQAGSPLDDEIPFDLAAREPADRPAAPGQGGGGRPDPAGGPGQVPGRAGTGPGAAPGIGPEGPGAAAGPVTREGLIEAQEAATAAADDLAAMAEREALEVLDAAEGGDIAVPLPGALDDGTGAAVTVSARQLLAEADDFAAAMDALKICSVGA